jgi:hypothetical protein
MDALMAPPISHIFPCLGKLFYKPLLCKQVLAKPLFRTERAPFADNEPRFAPDRRMPTQAHRRLLRLAGLIAYARSGFGLSGAAHPDADDHVAVALAGANGSERGLAHEPLA